MSLKNDYIEYLKNKYTKKPKKIQQKNKKKFHHQKISQ